MTAEERICAGQRVQYGPGFGLSSCPNGGLGILVMGFDLLADGCFRFLHAGEHTAAVVVGVALRLHRPQGQQRVRAVQRLNVVLLARDKVTSAGGNPNDPREIQFALKFYWKDL